MHGLMGLMSYLFMVTAIQDSSGSLDVLPLTKRRRICRSSAHPLGNHPPPCFSNLPGARCRGRASCTARAARKRRPSFDVASFDLNDELTGETGYTDENPYVDALPQTEVKSIRDVDIDELLAKLDGTAAAEGGKGGKKERSAGAGGGRAGGRVRGDIGNRDKLLKTLEIKGMEAMPARQALDAAEQASRQWRVTSTHFLPPLAVDVLREAFDKIAAVTLHSWGGFPGAERQRVFFHNSEMVMEDQAWREEYEDAFTALAIEGNFLFDPADHRDFLGAILGSGVERDRVGDVLVLGQRGAQVIVESDVAEVVKAELTSVRTVNVYVEPIPFDELRAGEAKRKEVSSVEASLRLDAVASGGMRISRSKMAKMIEQEGVVYVNWKEVRSSSKEVKAGDVITVRGKGRLEIHDISRTSRGRYRLQMTKVG